LPDVLAPILTAWFRFGPESVNGFDAKAQRSKTEQPQNRGFGSRAQRRSLLEIVNGFDAKAQRRKTEQPQNCARSARPLRLRCIVFLRTATAASSAE
jgi:hypothetical protein